MFSQILFDLIRSDQLTTTQVTHVLEDNPQFAKWYHEYIKNQEQQDSKIL